MSISTLNIRDDAMSIKIAVIAKHLGIMHTCKVQAISGQWVSLFFPTAGTGMKEVPMVRCKRSIIAVIHIKDSTKKTGKMIVIFRHRVLDLDCL